jgi:hypothetical protein
MDNNFSRNEMAKKHTFAYLLYLHSTTIKSRKLSIVRSSSGKYIVTRKSNNN